MILGWIQVTAVRFCSLSSAQLWLLGWGWWGGQHAAPTAQRGLSAFCFLWEKKRETAARVCLGLSSFLPKNIKTRSLNSERFRDQCRNNLGKNKSNEIKFSTSVWYLLLSECQKPTRLTHMNISTDSGSKEHCPAASQRKNISREIRNECLWGRRGKEASEKCLKLHTIMKDSLLFQSITLTEIIISLNNYTLNNYIKTLLKLEYFVPLFRLQSKIKKILGKKA